MGILPDLQMTERPPCTSEVRDYADRYETRLCGAPGLVYAELDGRREYACLRHCGELATRVRDGQIGAVMVA